MRNIDKCDFVFYDYTATLSLHFVDNINALHPDGQGSLGRSNYLKMLYDKQVHSDVTHPGTSNLKPDYKALWHNTY